MRVLNYCRLEFWPEDKLSQLLDISAITLQIDRVPILYYREECIPMCGFWEDLFDFNGDSKVDAGEEFLAMVMMEEGYRELRQEAGASRDDS